MAAFDAAKEAIYLRRLMKDLDINVSEPTKIFEDNQGVIKIAENPRKK